MLVIKKKYLVIGLLVVLLVITGYLNFIYNQNTLSTMTPGDSAKGKNDDDQIITDKNNGDVEEDNDKEKDKDKDTSDPEAKDTIAASSSSFFRDYRFEREHVRQDEIEYIKKIIDDKDTDKKIANEAQKQLLELTENMENEMAIETLIKAKGFKDVVAIINKNNVSVIVDKKKLEPDEVAQITNIVTEQTDEKPENVKIIPKI